MPIRCPKVALHSADRFLLHEILSLDWVTASFVPEGVEHAVATLRGQIGDHIHNGKRAGDVEGELLGWEALLALDALLFVDLK